MRDKVTMSPLPHPPTFAKSQPPWPWGLSCVLLFFLGHSSCLGGASQLAQGISPSATCARLAWEQRKGLIYDINDSEHMWLDKISCHVQYALLVPPDTWQCWELQVFHHPPPYLERNPSQSHLAAWSESVSNIRSFPIPLTVPSIYQLARAMSSQESSPNPAWHSAWKEKSLATSGKPFSQ